MTEFVYTIKSHPTSYKGVNFRSRLEATWAAFFDLCGWEWEYEPIDLPGWTPDFILGKSVAVEVKPIREVLSDTSRFVNSGWPHGLLLLGVNPYDPDRTILGWSMTGPEFQVYPTKEHLFRGEIVMRRYGEHASLDYDTDGGSGGFYHASDLWDEAMNTTQWKPA